MVPAIVKVFELSWFLGVWDVAHAQGGTVEKSIHPKMMT